LKIEASLKSADVGEHYMATLPLKTSRSEPPSVPIFTAAWRKK